MDQSNKTLLLKDNTQSPMAIKVSRKIYFKMLLLSTNSCQLINSFRGKLHSLVALGYVDPLLMWWPASGGRRGHPHGLDGAHIGMQVQARVWV